MALTPQIDNELNISTQVIELPSKTYKLDINGETNLDYNADYRNITTFKFENHNLIAIVSYPNPDIDFSIVDGNLVAESENEDLLNRHHIEGYNLYLDTEYFSDRIMGYVDNLEAVRQSVYHILMTERYAYLIYSNNYGIELNQYIGRGYDYLATTIEQTLKEALTYDLRITNVVVNEIKQPTKDTAEVNFTVYSVYGNLQLEVSINV